MDPDTTSPPPASSPGTDLAASLHPMVRQITDLLARDAEAGGPMTPLVRSQLATAENALLIAVRESE